MKHRKAIMVLIYLLAAIAVLASAYWYIAALATADMRFGHCGPSTLDHPEIYCQIATSLLHRSYWLAASAVALLAGGFVVKHKRLSAA